ncbi:MAG: hypothetical protein MUF54_21530 [Polyangiaceae bacterium]|nr:hypothetical protein [Polyangiaceae bacterium]
MDYETELRRRARYVAGRAVAETRTGLPYVRVSILPGEPALEAPAALLQWASPREAENLLVRLHAGLAALLLLEPAHEASAYQLAAEDLRRAAGVREQLQALKPERAVDDDAWLQRAQLLVSEPCNVEAINAIASELQLRGSLAMEEVDFLVEHADGDPDAVDALQRYRQLFAPEPVPWPDHT